MLSILKNGIINSSKLKYMQVNMKKKLIIAVAIIALLVLLFPIRNQLKDSGTIVYKSLLYKVSKVHALMPVDETETSDKVKPYKERIIIELLAFETYNNIK